MKLEDAQHKLLLAREHQKKLRVEIDTLKEIIIGYGVEPDQRFIGLKERNNEIYKLYKKEISFATIAKKYNLSSTRIASICSRINHNKVKKKLYPSKYGSRINAENGEVIPLEDTSSPM
jgi:hypothetical protein